jgi:hypothetical protein
MDYEAFAAGISSGVVVYVVIVSVAIVRRAVESFV